MGKRKSRSKLLTGTGYERIQVGKIAARGAARWRVHFTQGELCS